MPKHFSGKNSPQICIPFREHVMADWYTKTVLTIIAVCLLFLVGREAAAILVGREAAAPSRNFETSRIISGLDDVSRSLHDKSEGVQKVAICDVWSDNNNNCVVLRSKTSPNGPVLPILPVESEPRVNGTGVVEVTSSSSVIAAAVTGCEAVRRDADDVTRLDPSRARSVRKPGL